MIFPHAVCDTVDSTSSVCIVSGWVGSCNVLMHKYIKHWNYYLMVCGIREGSICSLTLIFFFTYSPLLRYHSLSLTSVSLFVCFFIVFFHRAHSSPCLLVSEDVLLLQYSIVISFWIIISVASYQLAAKQRAERPECHGSAFFKVMQWVSSPSEITSQWPSDTRWREYLTFFTAVEEFSFI